MTDRWLAPSEPEPRRSIEAERAELLIDVLGLVDALPAPHRRPLETPTFNELRRAQRQTTPA